MHVPFESSCEARAMWELQKQRFTQRMLSLDATGKWNIICTTSSWTSVFIGDNQEPP